MRTLRLACSVLHVQEHLASPVEVAAAGAWREVRVPSECHAPHASGGPW